MSIRTTARSSSNRKSARDRASSVLPTPVGPRNTNEPMGRFGSESPARARRMAFATAATASSWSTIRSWMASSMRTSFWISPSISRDTGIPVSRLMEGEIQKLVRMEDAIHERMVDQDEAVAAVANAIRRARAGLSDPNRPIGSFVFLGPTGVGKTELARSLADFLFDDERAVVRIDMSEYQERHAVSRLIGAPPGYVGYEEGGQLTEAIRRRPYSVILLDEIEKAHSDAFNVLLQLLDEGRLTDGQGRTVDFRNTVVIMTSNLGSYVFSDPTASAEERNEKVMAEVRATFRPEFLNRVDEIIVFSPLGRDDIAKIVDIQIRILQERLAARRLTVELTPAARSYLTDKGFDPAYGARPLKRLIQRRSEEHTSELQSRENL